MRIAPTGDELEPPEAAVVRAVNASVGRAERGVRAVVQRVQAIGVDVLVEPLWESAAASHERAAREIRAVDAGAAAPRPFRGRKEWVRR